MSDDKKENADYKLYPILRDPDEQIYKEVGEKLKSGCDPKSQAIINLGEKGNHIKKKARNSNAKLIAIWMTFA